MQTCMFVTLYVGSDLELHQQKHEIWPNINEGGQIFIYIKFLRGSLEIKGLVMRPKQPLSSS